MRINRAAIKMNAKNQMQATRPHACVVALIYILIVNVLSLLANKVMGYDLMDILRAMTGFDAYGIPVYPRFSFVGYLISLAISIVSGTIATGFTIYVLNISRMREAGIATLFDGFTIFLRALWLSILTGIFVFLWSMLFFIPGIIAAYRYRLALYLLIDNPQMSALECIRESKRLMKGRKWELFVLDLSFIGWSLLTIIPFVSIWVLPYTEVTYANYYLAVIGLEHGGSAYCEAPDDSDSEGTPPWEL